MKNIIYVVDLRPDIDITAHCRSFNFSTMRERYDRILHPSGMVIVRLTIKGRNNTILHTDNTTLCLDDELADYD